MLCMSLELAPTLCENLASTDIFIPRHTPPHLARGFNLRTVMCHWVTAFSPTLSSYLPWCICRSHREHMANSHLLLRNHLVDVLLCITLGINLCVWTCIRTYMFAYVSKENIVSECFKTEIDILLLESNNILHLL